ELRCPACNSDRVAAGRLSSFEGVCYFELPPQQPGFWGTLGPRVDLTKPAFLSIQCGMVWTHTSRDAAAAELARSGSDELLERLHIAAPRSRRWRWLLFGRR